MKSEKRRARREVAGSDDSPEQETADGPEATQASLLQFVRRALIFARVTPRSLLLTAIVGVVIGYTVGLFYDPALGRKAAAQEAEAEQLEKIPFDGAQAYRYLEQICELGPRPTGSDAMHKQQELLERAFAGIS